MPRVAITSLVSTVTLQDKQGLTHPSSITVPAGTTKTVNVTWEVLQKLAPQLAALDAAAAITYTINGTGTNFWAQEGDLPGMPRIDVVSKHDLIRVGETALTLTGLHFHGGQTYAENSTEDAVDARVRFMARLPGHDGNELTYEIIDSGGMGGLAVALVGTHLTIDFDGDTPTATLIAAAVNADAVAALAFNAIAQGTGAGNTALTATRHLAGGTGPGLSVTCAGLPCDVTGINGTGHPIYVMTIDVPNMTTVAGDGATVNLELRTGGKIATVSAQIAP